MDIDLNEDLGGDFCMQHYGVNEYVHRANEAINDDVGIIDLPYAWDLNVQSVEGEEELFDLNVNAGFHFDDNENSKVGVQGVDVEIDFNNFKKSEVQIQGEGDVEVASDNIGNTEFEGEGNLGDDVDDDNDEDKELSPPLVDDEFDSIEEALQYYELYAKKTGFSVVKRSQHKKRGTQQTNHYTFACSKCKIVPAEIEGPIPERKRAAIGTGCSACMKVGDTDLTGTWVVKKILLEHNHDLVPETAFLISGIYISNVFQMKFLVLCECFLFHLC